MVSFTNTAARIDLGDDFFGLVPDGVVAAHGEGGGRMGASTRFVIDDQAIIVRNNDLTAAVIVVDTGSMTRTRARTGMRVGLANVDLGLILRGVNIDLGILVSGSRLGAGRGLRLRGRRSDNKNT